MNPGRWISPEAAQGIMSPGTDAFRIFQSPVAWVDRFGGSAVVSAKTAVEASELCGGISENTAGFGWQPARVFFRELVKQSGGVGCFELLSGDPNMPPTETVCEDGLRFEVNFSTGYNTGFFADQRANRKFLRSCCAKRVLNTFAHTCSFSVAAASTGAATTNVDSAKAFLERGRRNFSLNGISTEGHRFVAEDSVAYMRRLAKRGERFDAIILDPPTFGRSGRREFRFDRDFPDLLRAAWDLAEESCSILISTNSSAWDATGLERASREILPAGTVFHAEPVPVDFSAHPPSSSVWALP